ncbi:uncharacterized protein LACBIDRAFT_316698 [Laccaria bicolor S238N-H82]|uniref:Predicted protein n=1 Tax=Laccaria bicolor (strain S238N-H82 / ATCC MYA-4686) TaxID=486041 RepID=B0E1F6_LACBS|nr:uncharacterized protein LACBIDRAFT_316698 [Laccaria bicolor S238N-H82]EDQ99299.1 predicted protein [Laccaria bicolor S238N-H82]|eukprot:XP_001890019.1 predicted protein [Laccaria bicolor S238N-H82]
MSDQGVEGVDPSGGVVNKKPLLKNLLRNWAKGQRLAFLEGFIADYKEALHTKKKASSVLDAIVNQWFTHFHWTIPLSSGNSATATVLPMDAQGHEILSPTDAILKGRVIECAHTSLYHWYEYRCKRTVPQMGKGKKDPISLLLQKLLRCSTSPTRRSAGWETWGKENFASLKAEFEADFAELDEDTQNHWNEVAKTKYEEVKKVAQERTDNSGLLSPAEAQAVLNDLPSVFGPTIQSIGEALGMHVTVLIGGPEPSKKGQLNMIGIHHGENKAAVPKVWPLAEKEKCALVKDAFILFLGTCYSIEEQCTWALPQPPTPVNTNISTTEGYLPLI